MTYMQSLIQGMIQNIAIYAVITNFVICLLYLGWQLSRLIFKNQTRVHYRMLKGIVLASTIPTFYLVFHEYRCIQNLHSVFCEYFGVGEAQGFFVYEYMELPLDTFLWLYLGVSLAISLFDIVRRLFLCFREQQFVELGLLTTQYDELLCECKRLVGTRAKVEICIHPYVPGPCVLRYKGRYRILLFEYAYSDKDIRTVLLHELGHIKNKDCHWKKAIMWLQLLCPLCPAVYLLARAYDEYCELNCDISTCQIFGKTRDYFGIVLDMAKYVSDHNQLRLYPSFCKSTNDVKRRVSHMSSYQKRDKSQKIWIHNLMSHCAVVVMLCGLGITYGMDGLVEVVRAKELEAELAILEEELRQEEEAARQELESAAQEDTTEEAVFGRTTPEEMQFLTDDILDNYTEYEDCFAWEYPSDHFFSGYGEKIVIPQGGMIVLDAFHVEAGSEILITVGGNKYNRCYALGLLSSNGTLRYMDELDDCSNIQMCIIIDEEDDYQVVVMNVEEQELTVSLGIWLDTNGFGN